MDAEAIAKLGKRKVTKGKHKGKEFNRTYTKVTKVLELPDEDGGNKAKAKKGVKASAKAADAKAKNAKSKATDDDDEAEEEEEAEEVTLTNKQADKMLVAVLKKQGKDGAIDKSGLPLAITRYFAATKGKGAVTSEEDRDALRRLVSDEEWLEEAADRGAIEFDKDSKKQKVAAA